jgi:hypothetical protein
MKTLSQPAGFAPVIIGLALLFTAITFIGVTDKHVLLLTNIRLDIVTLVITGMTIFKQGGISRIAAFGQLENPFSIISYFLDGLLLVIPLVIYVGWKLPFIAYAGHTFLANTILNSFKVVKENSHCLLAQSCYP